MYQMSDIESFFLYLLVIFISSLLFSFYKYNNKVLRIIGVSLAILIPSILAGMRFNVGTDYVRYYSLFDNIKNFSFLQILTGKHYFKSEIGFLMLSKFLSIFFTPKQIFGILYLTMIILFSYTILRDYRRCNLSFIYFLFLIIHFTQSLNLLRQYLSIILVFFSMKYIFECDRKKYIFFISVSASIHLSTLCALPMWMLWDHKKSENISKRKFMLIFISILIVVFFWRNIYSLLLPHFLFLRRYRNYLYNREANNYTFWLKLAITLAFLYINRKQTDNRSIFFTNLLILSNITQFIGFYVPSVKRISLFYSFHLITMFPDFVNIFKHQDKMLVELIIAVINIFYFFIWSFILKQSHIIPYQI